MNKFKKGDFAIWAFPENDWSDKDYIKKYKNKIVKIEEAFSDKFFVIPKGESCSWHASEKSLIPYKPILKKFIEEMEKKE